MTEEKPTAKKAPAKKAAPKKVAKEVVEEIVVEEVLHYDFEETVVEQSSDYTGDALEVLAAKDVVVYMKMGHSYSGPGFKFTADAPFQRMTSGQATELLQSIPDRFELATKGQVEEFYSDRLG